MLELLLLTIRLLLKSFLVVSRSLWRSFSILSTGYCRLLWIGLRLARFLLDSLCDEAVDGEICREGEDAVCGEVSEVISPENQMKRAGLVL